MADGILWKEEQRVGRHPLTSAVSTKNQPPAPSHHVCKPSPGLGPALVAFETILALPPLEVLTFQVAGWFLKKANMRVNQ